MKLSAYRNAAFELIHAHDLAILNWFMGHLSGASPLPNGGMVLAATSGSNTVPNPTLDIAIQELEFPPAPGKPAPTLYPKKRGSTFGHNPLCRSPFISYDQRVLDILSSSQPGLEVQRVKGLSKEEARGLMEYWAKSGMVRNRISESFIGEKWSLSGGGVWGSWREQRFE